MPPSLNVKCLKRDPWSMTSSKLWHCSKNPQPIKKYFHA